MTAETLILLEQKFPKATKAECRRFWDACRRNNNNNEVVTAGTKDATVLLVETEKALEEYLEWRRRLGMDEDKGNDSQSIESKNNNNNKDPTTTTNHHDAILWKKSCHRCEQIMMMRKQQVSSNKASFTTKEKRKTKDKSAKTSIHVPQFVFSHNSNKHNNKTSTSGRSQLVDNQGNQILHVLPALMDIQNVTAEWYGRTLQFYLDGLLNRESHDKVTVLLDVRPGEGWPNPMAVFMVNFIRKIAKMLQGRFPGRLEKLIVFPVPKPALGIFHAVRWVLSTELAEKIVLVSGSAERKSPLPKHELKTYISEDVLDFTETVRVAKFVPG
ncbi:CRAL/TRIO domain containing protein [Nitzschia inconspicua]|uniref:CRAL/TRIO domain containing protein n=1 Tax=Nitzschia inconspicua TaxID=303405 RepID=A0A9K3L3P6_9STRA|nr:CRAL/TRIO domain containing protein [Nitzschia inconspicua]